MSIKWSVMFYLHNNSKDRVITVKLLLIQNIVFFEKLVFLSCPCQYLVSVPLKMFRLWAFMGMMAQVKWLWTVTDHFLSSHTQTNTHWPLNFHLSRFLWLGSWAVSSMETTATPPCGCRSSSGSPSLCWCMSMTTMSFIMGALHSTGQTHTHNSFWLLDFCTKEKWPQSVRNLF